MSVRVFAVFAFLVALSALAADFTVGCGQGYVQGTVDQKYVTNGDASAYTIGINGRGYPVPENFYYAVSVGDVVRYDGKTWSKVTGAGSPSPNIPPALLVTPTH